MLIVITYQTSNNQEPFVIEMAPEEYFDPLGEGESFWNDGIEKYVFPHEYVDVPVEDLKWLTVCVSELGNR